MPTYKFYMCRSKQGESYFRTIHGNILINNNINDILFKSKDEVREECIFKSKYTAKFLRDIKDPIILKIYFTYMAEEAMKQHPELKITVL